MKQTNQDPFFEVKECIVNFELNGDLHRCDRHKAIVRTDMPHYFSIPTNRWELITYRESVEKADVIAKRIFDKNHLLDMPKELMNLYIEGYGEKCFFKFFDQEHFYAKKDNDIWTGFLMISNNYDCSGALIYEFGFIISDANINVIFDDLCVNVSFYHTKTARKNIEERLEEYLDKNKIFSRNDVINKFKEKIDLMSSCIYDYDEDSIPLLLKFLDKDLPKSDKLSKNTIKKLLPLIIEFRRIQDKYRTTSLYAFMKILAELIATSYYLAALKIKSKNEEDEPEDEEEIAKYEMQMMFDKNEIKEGFLSNVKIIEYERRLGKFLNFFINQMKSDKKVKVVDMLEKKYYKFAEQIESFKEQ